MISLSSTVYAMMFITALLSLVMICNNIPEGIYLSIISIVLWCFDKLLKQRIKDEREFSEGEY